LPANGRQENRKTMNKILSRTSHTKIKIIALAIALTVSACRGDDPAPLPETKKVSQMLTSSGAVWTPESITVDGVDVTDDLFPGFSITFLDETYSTTGTSPVWSSEDTWSFKDETATVIIRGSDQKEVTIAEISATRLKLTLDWPETTYGGRKSSLNGKHEFILSK